MCNVTRCPRLQHEIKACLVLCLRTPCQRCVPIIVIKGYICTSAKKDIHHRSMAPGNCQHQC